MPNEIKLVLKDHDCSRIGEISAWDSFDARSVVNGVGEAVLVAPYGASTLNDSRLDELSVGDIIIEAYVKPHGHTTFLPDPAWSGFLRDRRIEQDDVVKVGRYLFADYNDLLQRRVIEPPAGASHDEGYGTIPNVMRDLVRRHCAGFASGERQFPGFTVEDNDADDAGTLYGGTASGMVFGQNLPEWVRVNALYEWNGVLYAAMETDPTSGEYGAIWRSGDGYTWERVYDGAPGLYSDEVTGVYCLFEFNGQLFAGAGTEYGLGDAIVLRSPDGADWGVVETFADRYGVWALGEFDGYLYAGMSYYGECPPGAAADGYLVRSADGETGWTDVLTEGPVSCPLYTTTEFVSCDAIYSWGGQLYIGEEYGLVQTSFPAVIHVEYRARLKRSTDGTSFVTEINDNSGTRGSFLSFMDFDGYLYAGYGRRRGRITTQTTYGGVYRSPDGFEWEQVFGVPLDVEQLVTAVTCFTIRNDEDGNQFLLAGVGTQQPGGAAIWQTADGETWYKVAVLNEIPYNYILGLDEFLGLIFAGTGSYTKGLAGAAYGNFTADYGDIWTVGIAVDTAEDAGTVARWVNLLDKLVELSEQGSADFRVVGLDSFIYCATTQEFQFRVRTPQWGDDNRWDGTQGVGFSIDRGNVAKAIYENLRHRRPNNIYVLGPSADEERTVLEVADGISLDESPWARYEGVADAQAIESVTALTAVGQKELELNGPGSAFDLTVQETDKSHWGGEFGCDHPASWKLGDIVTATFAGAEANCKVEEVILSAQGGDAVYTTRAKFKVLEVSEAVAEAAPPEGSSLEIFGQGPAGTVQRITIPRWTSTSGVNDWVGARWRLTTGYTLLAGQLIVQVYCHSGSVATVKVMSSAGAQADTGVSDPVNPTLSGNASGVGISAGQTRTIRGSDPVAYSSPGYFTITTGFGAHDVELEILSLSWEDTFGLVTPLWP